MTLPGPQPTEAGAPGSFAGKAPPTRQNSRQVTRSTGLSGRATGLRGRPTGLLDRPPLRPEALTTALRALLLGRAALPELRGRLGGCGWGEDDRGVAVSCCRLSAAAPRHGGLRWARGDVARRPSWPGDCGSRAGDRGGAVAGR